VAVASAWPYASMHLAADRITTPAPHHSVFLQAGYPSCHLTNSVEALKAKADLLGNSYVCLRHLAGSVLTAICYASAHSMDGAEALCFRVVRPCVCVRLCLDGGILRPAYRRLLVCLSVNRKVVGGFYDIWAADRFLNGRFGLRFRARV